MGTLLDSISLYLANKDATFESLINENFRNRKNSDDFKTRNFKVDGSKVKFLWLRKETKERKTPPWLDFINSQMDSPNMIIDFQPEHINSSGLLLIEISKRILVATFGYSGKSMLNDHDLVSDFGIKTAMNICGNKKIRATKSSLHSSTPQLVNRQVSKPSDSSSFGMIENEILDYLYAHIPEKLDISLIGKDSLTLKAIKEEKLNWPSLIRWGNTFIEKYEKGTYREAFPNYLDLQRATQKESEELDKKLLDAISKSNEKTHLSIPEIIDDDKYWFTYTNNKKKDNCAHSYIDMETLKKTLKAKDITIEKLKKKYIYAYNCESQMIMPSKKWKVYDCLIHETDLRGSYYTLHKGIWRKVDKDFYDNVTNFVNKKIPLIEIPEEFHNISLYTINKKGNAENREEIFNKAYCAKNNKTVMFDKSKLKIKESKRDHEFCDIFELNDDETGSIIHVKKGYKGQTIHHLFTQAGFYSEAFLKDKTFLKEIRNYIYASDSPAKKPSLEHIKEDISQVNGNAYKVKLWLLYPSNEKKPNLSDLSIMTKYDLKLTYERLRDTCKFKEVSVSMIPTEQPKMSTSSK